MAFGENDAVVSEVPWVVGVELESLLMEEEHSHNVSD